MDSPPVVLLSVDSLRADYVGALSDSTSTPHIDELAAEGVRFTGAYAQGCGTRRSMAALMTGAYPNMFGGISQINRPTIASVLRDEGYHTVGIHSNPYLSRHYGYDRGFDRFHESVLPGGIESGDSTIKKLLIRAIRLINRTPYAPADDINGRIESALTEWDDSQPLFLWAHYMDPHGPYQQSRKYRDKYRGEILWQRAIDGKISPERSEELKSAYRAEVRRTDTAIGEVFDELKRRGIYDDAYIILCGDHGEAFGEHGFYGHPAEMYEEVLRVPLLIKPPNGRARDEPSPVGLMHVPSTMAGALDIDPPETFLGLNLLSAPEQPNEDGIITEAYVDTESKLAITQVQDGTRWRYVWDEVHDGDALFNLTDDGAESTNLIDEAPDVAERYRIRASEHIRMVRKNQAEYGTNEEPEIPESMEQRLADLGYLE